MVHERCCMGVPTDGLVALYAGYSYFKLLLPLANIIMHAALVNDEQ